MYRTVLAKVVAEQKVKRSRFICHLCPIASESEAKELIAAHNQEFANATHNCFAYLCGFNREIQYYSDAGEPHGTAGKPILNALLRNGLTNVLAIVTRYYGGVKLGTRGLIEAYGETAELAAGKAELADAVEYAVIAAAMDYPQVDAVRNAAKNLQGSVSAEHWAERAELELRIPKSKLCEMRKILDGLKVHVGLDYSLKE